MVDSLDCIHALSPNDIDVLRGVFERLCHDQKKNPTDDLMTDCAGALVRLYQQGIHDEPTLFALGRSSMTSGGRAVFQQRAAAS